MLSTLARNFRTGAVVRTAPVSATWKTSLRALSSMRPQKQAFPSMIISADEVKAQGSFAEAQVNFLHPDPEIVRSLDAKLQEKRMGVVAHFYMDPELQGTLSALSWPHVQISDSLAMGEAACAMAAEGATSIACLGVDFMSESVRATLDREGFSHIPVYRLSAKHIGCSLAESAEREAYKAFLVKAAMVPNSLHVVYINTSLKSKGFAHEIVPTITCTSSNVVRTILQAFAQVPDLTVWYGPDTYMGENLYHMFQEIARMPDERIRELHPAHDRASVASLLERFHFYQQGNCVVHHMFGDAVTTTVREQYADAFITAHLEVPGEMFALAMAAQNDGNRGVVGSTSNILHFIQDKTREASSSQVAPAKRLRFVLGTEAGMITSIVRGVQGILKASAAPQTEVEIIFPVASEAVALGEEGRGSELGLLPGVAGGEGCSTAGGCATCPFMKMNTLDALLEVAESVDVSAGQDPLQRFRPSTFDGLIRGTKVTDLGVVPIQHMRSLMRDGQLSDELVSDITSRHQDSGAPEARVANQ